MKELFFSKFLGFIQELPSLWSLHALWQAPGIFRRNCYHLERPCWFPRRSLFKLSFWEKIWKLYNIFWNKSFTWLSFRVRMIFISTLILFLRSMPNNDDTAFSDVKKHSTSDSQMYPLIFSAYLEQKFPS